MKTETILGAGTNGAGNTEEIAPVGGDLQTAPPARRGFTRVQLIGVGLLLLLAALPIPFGDFGFFVGHGTTSKHAGGVQLIWMCNAHATGNL